MHMATSRSRDGQHASISVGACHDTSDDFQIWSKKLVYLALIEKKNMNNAKKIIYLIIFCKSCDVVFNN